MTEQEVKEDIEKFFRKEFVGMGICSQTSDEIINSITSYCADPSDTFSLNIEDRNCTPGQEAAVQKLISIFLHNFKRELQNIRFRNFLN